MNLSQVRELKTGNMVKFTNKPFNLTVGKIYTIKKTGVGRIIFDDKGFGIPLASIINLEIYFEKVPNKPFYWFTS